MKLYATVTSERASKGQGGNNHIVVELTVETEMDSRQHFGTLKLVKVPASKSYCLYLESELLRETGFDGKIKGEKQKAL
jgi:hypothetical protein